MRFRASRFHQPVHVGAAHAVDHAVGDMRRDDLALQRMTRHVRGVALAQCRGKVSRQRGFYPRIVGQPRSEQLVVEPDLAVRENDRNLGRRETRSARAALDDLVIRRQIFERAIEPPAFFEELDEPLLRIQQVRRDPVHDGKRLRLEVIVTQHQCGDVIGHLRKQGVTLLFRQFAIGNGQAEQNLDVHFMVGRIDTSRIVDRVGVDTSAGKRVLDTPKVCAAEVTAFGDHFAAQLAAIDAERVVRTIADLRVRFASRFHVCPDAAVVQEIDGRLEDRADELGRRHDLGPDRQCLCNLGADGNRLRASRIHPTAGRNRLLVVIGPGRARQREQPFAFGEGHGNVGVGIEKNVTMVERCHQFDVA